MTVVVDYGVGNLRSVEKALLHLGCAVTVSGRTEHIEAAERLVLPGVGAFGAAMERLEPLACAVRRHAESGKPLLGICLGQQLLFESSEEHGFHRGLSILKGVVRSLPAASGVPLPHIGWNELEAPNGKLFQGVAAGDFVYFVHGYYVDEPGLATAWCTHGIRFPAAVEKGNVMATQFHPEKSGETGLRILRNFLACS